MTNSTEISKYYLVTQEKQKQNEGFQQLKSQLLGFILNRIPDRDDAEDVLHDVYLQMAGMVEPIEQLRSWLFRVTKNKITDRFRKKKATSFANLGEGQEAYLSGAMESTSSLPDEEMMENLVWETIRNALEELPRDQREAFEMHELEGISFQSMSEILGEPVNTLISRKHYAIKHLRKRLGYLYDELKK